MNFAWLGYNGYSCWFPMTNLVIYFNLSISCSIHFTKHDYKYNKFLTNKSLLFRHIIEIFKFILNPNACIMNENLLWEVDNASVWNLNVKCWGSEQIYLSFKILTPSQWLGIFQINYWRHSCWHAWFSFSGHDKGKISNFCPTIQKVSLKYFFEKAFISKSI